jgi:hypothetical protein
MNTIKVRVPTIEPTFTSAEKAIAAASAVNDRAKRESHLSRCIGKIITNGFWDDLSLTFWLEDMETLRFCCKSNLISSNVFHDPMRRKPEQTREFDSLVLELNSQQIVWERANQMNDIIGSVIMNIFSGQTNVFLYLKGKPTYCLSQLINSATDMPLLFWYQTD